MKTNLDNLESVAQLLEQLALEAERAGKPFQWAPWATVRNAATELAAVRKRDEAQAKAFSEAVEGTYRD